MSIFGLFGMGGSRLRAVVDVGSHSIKTVVFELPRLEEEKTLPPKVLKKTVIALSASPEPVRVVTKLREVLFSTIKELGRVPSSITIALGPYLAEHSLAVWGVDGNLSKKKSISRKELGTYFQNLFEQKRDPRRALIAYPLDLRINEYSLRPLSATKEKLLLGGAVSFETMLLYFPSEIGSALATAKQSLGGLPIEFIPLLAAHQESIPDALGISDAFLVDIGGEETTLAFLKEGVIAHVASFPLGAHSFVRKLAQALSVSFDEAEDLKRQYNQGVAGDAKNILPSSLMEQEVRLWKDKFLDRLDSFYTSGPLPPKILFFGGGAYVREIETEVRKPEWIRDFSYASMPEVQVLRAESFFQGDSLGGSMGGPEDVGTASLMVYSMRHAPMFG